MRVRLAGAEVVSWAPAGEPGEGAWRVVLAVVGAVLLGLLLLAGYGLVALARR